MSQRRHNVRHANCTHAAANPTMPGQDHGEGESRKSEESIDCTFYLGCRRRRRGLHCSELRASKLVSKAPKADTPFLNKKKNRHADAASGTKEFPAPGFPRPAIVAPLSPYFGCTAMRLTDVWLACLCHFSPGPPLLLLLLVLPARLVLLHEMCNAGTTCMKDSFFSLTATGGRPRAAKIGLLGTRTKNKQGSERRRPALDVVQNFWAPSFSSSWGSWHARCRKTGMEKRRENT